jgi:DNA-binding LytR/AlgR family response regulator
VLYLALGDILLLIAEGSYTRVHCQDGSEYLMCGNLQKVVNRLPSGRFHRCHRRYVINLGKITKLIRNGGYRAVLNTGIEVEVSRRHWAALLLAMGGA